MNNRVGYNLYRILAATWRSRYYIIIPSLILPIFGLLLSSIAPRHYQTQMSFLIQETASMNPFLADFSVSSQIKERMSALQTLLHSRHILLGVIDELQLAGEEASDARKEQVLSRLSSALTVQLVGSDLVKLSYSSSDNRDIAAILSKVSERFIAYLLAPEQSSLTASETFLAQQLKQRADALQEAERQLEQFKTEHAQALPQLHTSTVNQLRQTEAMLSEKQVQLSGAKATLASLQQKLSQTNPVLGNLEQTLVNLMSELALLRTRYTENHSLVQARLRQIEQLQQKRQSLLNENHTLTEADMQGLWQLASHLQSDQTQQPLLISQLNLLQTAQSQVEQFTHETQALENRIQTLQQQVDAHGKIERTLNQLEHEWAMQTKLHDDLLNRYQMANVTSALGRFEAPERVKIIDKPYTPSTPSNLPWWLYVIGGFFGGLSLGIAITALREMTQSCVRYPDQVTALIGVPVISQLPPLQFSFANQQA